MQVITTLDTMPFINILVNDKHNVELNGFKENKQIVWRVTYNGIVVHSINTDVNSALKFAMEMTGLLMVIAKQLQQDADDESISYYNNDPIA